MRRALTRSAPATLLPRPAALALARPAQVTLLAGPTALAFAKGGYFTDARLVALLVAYAVLAAALLAGADRRRARDSGDPEAGGPSPFAVAAIGGLALLAGWTALSAAWAPVEALAVDARERTLLYLAALWAAALVFRDRSAALWVEPALAAGAVVVIGYGVLGRLGVLDLQSTLSAGGRLDQPLTYWNAEGALAALGLVLCVRLAAAAFRPTAVRLVAAGAAPLLALGVYLTFSRGALTALVVGLAVLVALTPTWPQLRALAIALEAAVLAVVAYEVLPRAGAAVALLGVMLAAAALQAWSARAEEDGSAPAGPIRLAAQARMVACALAAVAALAPFAVALAERGEAPVDPAFGATAERFGSADSHRYAYWDAAVATFAEDPAIGTGAGGFQAAWLERRTLDVPVRDAHSLVLETAAELGLVGLALLGLFVGGVAAATRRLVRSDPALAVGPAAALALWAAHAAIDWDWEMPALTLVAAILAGVVLAQAPGSQRVRSRTS